ncbi:nucleotidyltransferase domain-containing protein [Pseudomonas fragariae (ex Marin et al. 2024)]|uniref:nucleotidyltransferase domain-containing protein n=1 Tax=Pseudomonas TaxID=286 RepID=UPI0006ACD037|nr:MULTISPECIES: nucleotidyltransferase domain-containing protein [Pseudomonas syringae group]
MSTPYEEDLLIYGFGSYFNGKAEFQDIDLLIVHESTNKESCIFAIRCKEILKTHINDAHISILSKSEATQLSFLEKSNSVLIGLISYNTMYTGAQLIIEKIIKQCPEPTISHEFNNL